MISAQEALNSFREFRDAGLANCIWENGLRIKRGNYEYVFNADEINYIGNGSEFVVASFTDDWTQFGNPAMFDETLALDGASWLERGQIELGGRDFQIVGLALEEAEDMTIRRKIFELYTSAELNISLYSSGAGKNLDLLVNCGGTFDNYNCPAILEREFTFALLWRQETSTLVLKINGEEIYSLKVAGLTERQTFEHVLIGGSMLHANATWNGTISNLKIYDGYAG